ncbi:MAG: hypothetical protein OMM_10763, partial [Candidatus Magnetoglobus multicellularis str. Araruama]
MHIIFVLILITNNVLANEKLIIASGKGNIEEVTKLLKEGVNIAAHDSEWNTPLMKASENGHLEIVKLLIENGADISIQQSIAPEYTALIVASIKGHLEIVKYLVEHGAHISTSDIEGMTAVKHACEQ